MTYFLSFAITLLGFLSLAVTVAALMKLFDFLDVLGFNAASIAIILACIMAFSIVWLFVHIVMNMD